jgi:hypothetical protein
MGILYKPLRRPRLGSMSHRHRHQARNKQQKSGKPHHVNPQG